MHKLTQHLFDPNVPRTTNQLEGKFSGAQQKSEKKRFKTVKGCISNLKPIIERQNDELKTIPNKEEDKEKENNDIVELRKSIKQLFER